MREYISVVSVCGDFLQLPQDTRTGIMVLAMSKPDRAATHRSLYPQEPPTSVPGRQTKMRPLKCNVVSSGKEKAQSFLVGRGGALNMEEHGHPL